MNAMTDFFWRLLPANPILLRVIATSSKRTRDLIIRCAYLGLLVMIVVVFIMQSGRGSGDLSALSRTSALIFERLSYIQLLLVAMLAPIFTASAITAEKDSQTYDILLSTPLTNGQIVLGSLFSRLFFIFALLLSGIPIFSITQIFGGVAIGDIVMSVLIAAATAMATGALAIAIATFKVGTRRTIFSFYLFNVLYLVGLGFASQLSFMQITLADGSLSKTTWLTALHPFLALYSVLDPTRYTPPTLSQLPLWLQVWPLRAMWTSPATFYVSAQFLLSAVLVLPSIILLRKMAQSTTGGLKQAILKLLPIRALKATRKPRTVWSNPIAWREAKTKASAARSTVLRLAFILLGICGAAAIMLMHYREARTPSRYLDVGSYDPSNKTLFIHGDSVGTYVVDSNTRITLADRRVGRVSQSEDQDNNLSLDELNGRYECLAKQDKTVAGSKYLVSLDVAPIARQLDLADARRWLLAMVLLEVTAILLIVTNAAASTVTREREDGTLDLLLSSPITSQYYIWGKLRGLVSYVLPLIAVPAASCLLFVIADLAYSIWHGGTVGGVVLPESIIVVPGLLVVLAAFGAIVGMQLSLRFRTTTWAVMTSVGIVMGLFGLLGWCGYAMLAANRPNEAVLGFSAFSPMTVLMLMIAPAELITGRTAGYGANLLVNGQLESGPRSVVLVLSCLATAAYATAVYFMYKSVVKNFDMTIRKQSR